MTGKTLSVDEVAAALGVHPNTVRARVNDRSRSDAFPLEAIDKGIGRIRIHESVLPRAVTQPTPIRPVDLPYGGRDSVDDRVATLLAKIRELQTLHLEVVTENLKLRQELDLLRIERGAA